jgi:hypothetical protein
MEICGDVNSSLILNLDILQFNKIRLSLTIISISPSPGQFRGLLEANNQNAGQVPNK